MSIETLYSITKAIYFLLVLQTAGGWLYYHLFASQLQHSEEVLEQRLIKLSYISFFYALTFQWFDAVKFMGNYDAIADLALQKMILQSSLGLSKIITLLGLALIMFSIKIEQKAKTITATIGIALIALSFTYTGHTSDHEERVFLAPALFSHIMIIFFWFGSLLPMILSLRLEENTTLHRLITNYSRMAVWLVPVIFISGMYMAWTIMDGFVFTDHIYGRILLFKAVIFGVLMLLATINKWRLGPALETNKRDASLKLQRSILLEFNLIVFMIIATAILTSNFSPD